LTLKNPRQQSGQRYISKAYGAIKTAREAGNTSLVVWIPRRTENEFLGIAKRKAKEATKPTATQQPQQPGMRSTVLRIAWVTDLGI
jgi:hypothetical protein